MNIPKDRKPKQRGGAKYPFPERLFDLLEEIDTNRKPHLATILSWHPTGRYFTIHDRDAFQKSIQKKYFNQSKFASFRRQINLWGFERLSSDKNARKNKQESSSWPLYGDSFYHPLFRRYDRNLCCTMTRSKVKKEDDHGTRKLESLAKDTSPLVYDWGASYESKRTPFEHTKMGTTTDFPLLSQEQERPHLQQQPVQDMQMRRIISNTSFYGDEESSLLQKLTQDNEEEEESSSMDDGEPLPFAFNNSSEHHLQLESVEKELGGNDQSFKELLDFLSDCDENLYKFLLGDCHKKKKKSCSSESSW